MHARFFFLLHGSSLLFSDHPLQPLNRSCKIQDVLGKAELSLQQFSLRVDYFTRKQTGLFREFKCSYNDHTYYHISLFLFFFYRCLKTRSLSSYTYTKCSYPLLSKRNCFLLFLLLPATLNNMHSFFSSKEKLAASYGERTKKN